MRFLALLELCKQGRVSLDQGHTFGDLEVAWVASDDRRAGAGRVRRLRRVRGLTMPADARGPGHRGRPDRGGGAGAGRPAGRAPGAAGRAGRRRSATSWPSPVATEGRGFELVRIAGGYRIQTHPDLAPYVERFANEGVSSRLSAAALETLAIVAYKQPVSRAQIAALRGVNVDGVVRLLEQRGYIAAVGRAPGPGQAVLYGTTDAFLERLGLDRLDQLPPVEDLLPGPEALAELEEQMRPVGDG